MSRFGGGEAVRRYKRIGGLCLLAGWLFMCSGCAPGPEKAEPPANATSGSLVCVQYSSFSGTFPEDGSGRQVNNVAAILVHNSSAEFLDYAKVSCAIGNESGTFLVTGLPPGATAWVLEKDAKTVKADENFGTMQCREYSFRQDAVMATDKLAVSTSGSTVTVVNQSGQILRNVCLYYKSVHDDGNYFGGITYMLSFGDLDPGETAQKQSSHYGAQSQIVRYSFQES